MLLRDGPRFCFNLEQVVLHWSFINDFMNVKYIINTLSNASYGHSST